MLKTGNYAIPYVTPTKISNPNIFVTLHLQASVRKVLLDKLKEMEIEVNVLLKQAGKTTNAEERLRLLSEVGQLIIDDESSTLLNGFFDEIVQLVFRFPNFDLLDFLISFCGLACRIEVYLVECAVPIILNMLSEVDDHLLKRILSSMALIYHSASKWVLRKPPSQFGVDRTWLLPKTKVSKLVFKFLERCILAQIEESCNLKSSAYGCQLVAELQASNDLNDATFLDRFLNCCKKLIVDKYLTVKWKVMRFHFTTLVKLPCLSEAVLEIASILHKLGISPAELAHLTGVSRSKSGKRLATEDDFNTDEFNSAKRNKKDHDAHLKQVYGFLGDSLTPENCVQLILAAFPYLPNNIPEKFLQEYAPIDFLPINEQIDRILNTIASMICSAGLSFNLKLTNKIHVKKSEEKKDADLADKDDDEDVDGERGRILSYDQNENQSMSKLVVKVLDLVDKVVPLPMQHTRSLGYEDAENQRHILITMCSLYEMAELKEKLLQEIVAEASSSGELALQLLYYQYSIYLQLRRQSNTTATEKALNHLIYSVVWLSPQLSVQALQHRPGQRKELFAEFASLSTFDDDTAIVNGWLEKLNSLHRYPPAKDLVKELALNHLHVLEQVILQIICCWMKMKKKSGMKDQFEFIFVCIVIYFHSKLTFCDVYVACGVNVKHLINTYLSKPIKQSSIPVNDIVELVKQCPRNAEALIPRILEHWLDKNSLNAELVIAVWTLYTKRRPDVRYLVPILPALNKEQFISLLPKLIRLPAQIINMITGKVVCSISGSKTVITADELWFEMYELEVTNENDFTQLLNLFGVLLQNKHMFRSDLLSGKIKQISERQVVPAIFFHTIPLLFEVQASLDNLIGSILQKFVTKQIWKQEEDVWQAFVQCSSKLKIHGYAALLQLPASQLRNAIETCPELRQDLLKHIENMGSQQKASITKDCVNELEKQRQLAVENDEKA
ncbi:Symplekin [Trichinella murrelli]|uniref:Symplekin n=1 Tax=Trichinella murrelli TaxID=144512 RepID=A0A0V0UIM9_9BILA|nr:Symplekin [Trichinella murrelli]